MLRGILLFSFIADAASIFYFLLLLAVYVAQSVAGCKIICVRLEHRRC